MFDGFNMADFLVNFRHYGALGNIKFENGHHELNIVDSVISLNENNDAYIGDRGIVIHSLADDYTGASGHAGPRIACCHITKPSKITKNFQIPVDFSRSNIYGVVSDSESIGGNFRSIRLRKKCFRRF